MKSVVKLLDVSRVMADCLFQFSDHHIFPLLLKCFNVSIVCGIILSLRAESVVGCLVLSQEEIGIRCQLCFRYSSCAQIYFIHFVNNDGCHLGFNLIEPLIFLARSWYLSTFSFSFSSTLVSPDTAMSIRSGLLLSLSTTTMSGRRCYLTWSVWIFMSHSILTFSLSVTGLAVCWYHCCEHCTPPPRR